VAVVSPPELEQRTAEEVLAYAVEHHHPRLALACSFQKEEAVLVDMLLRLEPAARVFTIDTGVLFPETHATWREWETRYGLNVEVHDALSPDDAGWSADNCCSVAKVAALGRALDGLDGWITGLRRDQASTRADASKVAWDDARGLWKFNPLADWTEAQVWTYVLENGLAYNPLHDAGYASIGCVPCTQPGAGREGRWAGRNQTECGIHGEG
jgi:phosphoadenosine phosphosulfate reductase